MQFSLILSPTLRRVPAISVTSSMRRDLGSAASPLPTRGTTLLLFLLLLASAGCLGILVPQDARAQSGSPTGYYDQRCPPDRPAADCCYAMSGGYACAGGYVPEVVVTAPRIFFVDSFSIRHQLKQWSDSNILMVCR